MKESLKMPKLARGAAEGTITTWHRKEGDYVFEGEVLLEVEVDKIAGEIESPCNGILRKVICEEGATMPVGAVVAEVEREPLHSRR